MFYIFLNFLAIIELYYCVQLLTADGPAGAVGSSVARPVVVDAESDIGHVRNLNLSTVAKSALVSIKNQNLVTHKDAQVT